MSLKIRFIWPNDRNMVEPVWVRMEQKPPAPKWAWVPLPADSLLKLMSVNSLLTSAAGGEYNWHIFGYNPLTVFSHGPRSYRGSQLGAKLMDMARNLPDLFEVQVINWELMDTEWEGIERVDSGGR